MNFNNILGGFGGFGNSGYSGYNGGYRYRDTTAMDIAYGRAQNSVNYRGYSPWTGEYVGGGFGNSGFGGGIGRGGWGRGGPEAMIGGLIGGLVNGFAQGQRGQRYAAGRDYGYEVTPDAPMAGRQPAQPQAATGYSPEEVAAVEKQLGTLNRTQVVALQTRLTQNGFGERQGFSPIDGEAGPLTLGAVLAVGQANGWKASDLLTGINRTRNGAIQGGADVASGDVGSPAARNGAGGRAPNSRS